MEEISSNNSASVDVGARIRDIEEKQRLLRDRVMLIGKNFISDREKLFSELNEIKKDISSIKEENSRLKEVVQHIIEQLSTTARKEEVLTLTRQFDLFRKA